MRERACAQDVRVTAKSVCHGARIDNPSRNRTVQRNVVGARKCEYRPAGAYLLRADLSVRVEAILYARCRAGLS